jgi:hypothetical protein
MTAAAPSLAAACFHLMLTSYAPWSMVPSGTFAGPNR